MDDIDKMLQGGDTAPASPAGTDGQTGGQTTTPSDEEVEFNNLSGTAQDRIRELVRRARTAEDKATEQTYQQQVPQLPQVPDSEALALRTLSQKGVALKDDVRAEVSQATNQIRWELEQSRLMQSYSGSDGLPKYDPDEVEDYVKTHPQYAQTPRELVFKSVMFPDEFASKGTVQTQTPTKGQTIRPVRQVQRQDALTPEYIEKRLAQEDGDEWYEANKDEINKVVFNHTQQFKDVNFGGQ